MSENIIFTSYIITMIVIVEIVYDRSYLPAKISKNPKNSITFLLTFCVLLLDKGLP